MGNAYDNGISPTLLEFQIVKTHPLDYYKQIKHKKTGQSLLVKQIIPKDESDSSNIQSIIEAKMHYKSTFVTQLVYWEKPVSNQLCSKSQSYLFLFNNVGTTLTQYLKSLRMTKLSFQTEKLSNILQQVLKGLKYFNTVHHLHKQISSDCIFYDGYRAILMDPWLTSQKHNISAFAMKPHRQVRKNIYKSPQKQLYQRDEIQTYDFLKSNVYELGLLIMDLATDGKYSDQYEQIYDKRFAVSKQKIRKVNIGVILEGIQDFQLKSKLNILLNPNPDKRLTIFNIMLPQRITLKEFNPVNKNNNFRNLPHTRYNTEFTQTSSKKPPKSLKKVKVEQKNPQSKDKQKVMSLNSLNILRIKDHTPQKSQRNKYESLASSPRTQSGSKKLEKQRNKSVSSTPKGSMFTYAQWLPNYTQSNETAFLSKKQQKQIHSNSFYHQPHKILKNIQSHKTSPNNSLIKQSHQSSKNYNLSYQDHLSPKQSFINELNSMNKNNGDNNLNTIEQQMNSYIASGAKIGSSPLSREDSNIKLSENQSNKNLLPSFNRNNNMRCHYQASPQGRPLNPGLIRQDYKSNINVRFHISNPSPQKQLYNQPQQFNNNYTLQPPKLSPGINTFSTPKQYYSTNANTFSNIIQNNMQNYPEVKKQKEYSPLSNKIVLQKKQSKQSKSSKSSQSSPATPSFHRRLFPQTLESKQKENPHKNIEGKRIIKQIKMGDIGMVKKTKTIESMEEDSQQDYQIKQVEQEYESSKSYNHKQSLTQLEKQMIENEKEKSLKKEKQIDKQEEKEKDRSRQSSKVSKSSSKNRLSYIKISTPDKKKSIEEYSVNFTQSNQEDSGEDREKDNNATSDKFHHRSEKDRQSKKQQKGSLRNEYTSDLDSAKEAQSIIFDSESKTNLRKQLSKIRKNGHHSLRNSLDRNSLNKNISFGPPKQAVTKQTNLNKVKNKIINNTDIRPTQESDFIKKIISMTNFKNPDKNEKISQQLSLFEANTAKRSQSKKPSLYNEGGKLTLSIQTSPLASIQSVVDNNYGSSLFGNLKRKQKNNNSSPYLKNRKNGSTQEIEKIQQELQSAVIGEQLGNSSEYSIDLNKKFSSKNKGFKRPDDKNDVAIEQPLKTQNTLINQLRSIKLESNEYNSQSNQSLKYYVIEKYPLSSNNQPIEKYQGYKCNGFKDGFGTYYYANGDIYHGEWKNDKRHGQGGVYRRRKKENGLNIANTSLVTQNIIHNKQQYDIVCQGLWENDQFVPNIDTNSNNSNKNSSNPVSPPSSPNIFSKSSPDKYKTSLVNLLPIPSKIYSSFQGQLHPTKKSLGEEISFVTSQNFQSQSSCSIGKNQKTPEFIPLTQIITLKNGDLFKGKSITNKQSDNQMMINGKLIKKNGQIVEGTWLYRENQLFEIK